LLQSPFSSPSSYLFTSVVRIDPVELEKLSESKKQDWVKSCPTKVYAYRPDTRQVSIEDATRCTYCQECVVKAESLGVPDLVSIKEKPERFIFSVESNGALRPEEIVETAMGVIKDKLTTIEQEISRLNLPKST
jgi:DNA-directed RNA polymerase II subunit RPB3